MFRSTFNRLIHLLTHLAVCNLIKFSFAPRLSLEQSANVRNTRLNLLKCSEWLSLQLLDSIAFGVHGKSHLLSDSSGSQNVLSMKTCLVLIFRLFFSQPGQCSAVGASLCYLLSYCFGRPLIQRYFSERVEKWSEQVAKHNANLTFYIIFLRITPFLPNWFINIASPLINVHLGCFFIGTFIGVAAPSFVAIEAGKTLNKLTSTKDFFSYNSLLLLALFATLSLLPVLFRERLKRYTS